MKKIIALLTISLLFMGCWKTDKPTPPRELATGVFQQETIKVYGLKKVWSVKDRMYIDTVDWVKDSVVNIKEFEVIPNGKQTMKFASESGYNSQRGWAWVIIGVLLVIGLFISGKMFEKGQALLITRAFLVVLAVAFALLTSRPANIAQNNAKIITEKQLNYYQSIDPELNYFWDSIFNEKRIIGGK